MAAELRMQLDAMVTTAQFLGNQADELKAELESITKEWGELSATWTGVAASAFDPPFDEWHYGASHCHFDSWRRSRACYPAQRQRWQRTKTTRRRCCVRWPWRFAAMSRRYTVDPDALLRFADRLARFNARAEEITAAVDRGVAELQATWLGQAATAHLEYHDKWLAAAQEMRDGLDKLRANARVAHHNYTGVAQHNTAMWP